MDSERVTIMVADAEKYIADLEDLGVHTIADLREKKNFYAASMVLLSIFSRVIDIGQELVLAKKLGVPPTYAEIFALLRKANIITEKLFVDLKKIVRIRNKLSHEYFTFTEKDVFEGLKVVDAAKEFIGVALKAEKHG